MPPLVNVEALRDLIREVVRDELGRREPRADYMTTADAAAFTKLKAATIREWAKAGRLRAIRVGRQLRITRADLEAAMAAGRGKRAHETAEAWGRREARAALGPCAPQVIEP